MRKVVVAMGLLGLMAFPGSTTTAVPVGDDSPPTPVVRPPDAVLSSSSGSVVGRLGSYCWRQSPTGGVCVDTIDLPEPTAALTVTAGETLTLRFATDESPTAIAARRYDAARFSGAQPFPVAAANPTQFRADLPVGTSWLAFHTRWAAGDATYYFRVRVLAPVGPPDAGPATPVRRQPHFTG